MEKRTSSWRGLTIFLLGLVLAFASIASADGPSPIRIMPLGDSITYGTSSTGTVGYRRALHQQLVGAGYSVDFVGSLTTGSPEDFDRNHEGHSGWRADQIRDNIYSSATDSGWLKNTPADAILLHIGTNDISGGQSPVGVAAEIGGILDRVKSYETAHGVKIWVVLARIINRDDWGSANTTTLNGLIQGLADARIAAGDRIVVVDMESALIYPGDLEDDVHPKDGGYGKMAVVWFAALDALLVSFSDHDGDGDVDGLDLSNYIAEGTFTQIANFAANFGSANGP